VVRVAIAPSIALAITLGEKAMDARHGKFDFGVQVTVTMSAVAFLS
jgi:hypothetical protein